MNLSDVVRIAPVEHHYNRALTNGVIDPVVLVFDIGDPPSAERARELYGDRWSDDWLPQPGEKASLLTTSLPLDEARELVPALGDEIASTAAGIHLAIFANGEITTAKARFGKPMEC